MLPGISINQSGLLNLNVCFTKVPVNATFPEHNQQAIIIDSKALSCETIHRLP